MWIGSKRIVTLTLTVAGMRGRDCETHLEFALIALPGVTAVYADAEKAKIVIIGQKPYIDRNGLILTIEKLGYRCRLNNFVDRLRLTVRRWFSR